MPMLPAELMSASTKVLEALAGKKPDEEAPALLFAMGRLAGKHGIRGKTAKEFWALHSNSMAESLFTAGFELERKAKGG